MKKEHAVTFMTIPCGALMTMYCTCFVLLLHVLRVVCSIKKVQYRAVPAQVEQQVFSTGSFQNQTQTVDVT